MEIGEEVKVSVVIPVWNGRAFLGDCLDALLAQQGVPFEVIAVDDRSPDDSAVFIARHYPQVRLLRNEYNMGFAGACNVGMRAARGEILVLLNQDTVVRPGWLAAMVRAFEGERVGVVGCKILYPDGETIQHAGGWIEWPLGLAYHYGHHERDDGRWDEPRQVDFVTGASMAVRRAVLETIGMLDEGFWPGYYEDVDFCLRVQRAGYEVWYIPDAVLIHRESASRPDSRRRWEAYHRGRLRLVLKYLPPERFLTQFAQAEARHQPAVVAEVGCRPLCRAYLETIVRVPPVLRQHWRAEGGTIKEIVRALQRLHLAAWEAEWRVVEERVTAEMEAFVARAMAEADEVVARASVGEDAGEAAAFPSVAVDVPPLTEWAFDSDTPLVGTLLARIREGWYSVAARWAVRHLMQQQDAINRQMASFSREQDAINRVQREVNRQQKVSQRRHEVMMRRQEATLERYLTALEDRLRALSEADASLAAEIAALRARVNGGEEAE